jgi:hypothetical protein
MGEMRNAYKMLMGIPERKRLRVRPERRWGDNIRMDFRETGLEGLDWMNLAQDGDQWWVVVKAVMNLRFHKRRGIFYVTEWLLSSQEGLCCM